MATIRFRASFSFRQRKVLDDSAFPSDGIRRVLELYTSPDGKKCRKESEIDSREDQVKPDTASLTQSQFFR